LRLNGFFTVTEFPVVARTRRAALSLTDMDILAVRFPHAQHWIPGDGVADQELGRDKALDIDSESMQLIIGEVKEGKAWVNRSALKPQVLEAVVRRFGCCEDHPKRIAHEILKFGSANTAVNGIPCRVRLIVFGGVEDEYHPTRYTSLPLKHVVEYMNAYMLKYADVFQPAELKDEGLSIMALMAKLGLKVG
jgi:hypothetical protein